MLLKLDFLPTYSRDSYAFCTYFKNSCIHEAPSLHLQATGIMAWIKIEFEWVLLICLAYLCFTFNYTFAESGNC